MSQNDHSLANADGATFRADANSALQALASQNSGTTAPSTTYAYMLWADTTTGLLKQRNGANSAWVTIGTLDQPGLNLPYALLNWIAGGGTADAITATYSPAITALTDGMLVGFRASAANATATPTFSPNGLTARTITRTGGTPLVPGDIPGNLAECLLRYNSANTRWELLNPAASFLAGDLVGLTLSAAGGSATFGIAAGRATDSTNVAMMVLASAFTKTTSAWAVGTGNGGLDTGSIANSTWYHVYLIKRPDTGVVDVIFSTSASAPTLPSNYTLYRRIGSIRTNGSAQWIKFSQNGDEFLWDVMTADVAVTNLGTTGTLYTLTVPTGVKVNARFRASFKNGAVDVGGFMSSPDESDQIVSVAAGKSHFVVSVAGKYVANDFNIRTNTSAQIRAISDTASSTLNISTYGWIDRRGRD